MNSSDEGSRTPTPQGDASCLRNDGRPPQSGAKEDSNCLIQTAEEHYQDSQLRITRSKMTSDVIPRDKRKLQTSRYAEEFVPKNGKILKNNDHFEAGDWGAPISLKKEFTFSVCGDPDNIHYAFAGDPGDTLLSALNSSCDFEEKVRSDSTILAYGEGPLKGLVNFNILCRYLPQHTHFRLVFLRSAGREGGAGDQPTQMPPVPSTNRCHVLFYIEPSGRTVGNTTQRIVVSDRIAQGQTKLCVLGFVGETIREALAKDGRFDVRLEDDTHKLLEKVEPPCKIQFNHPVDALHSRSFQVELSVAKKKPPPSSCSSTAASSDDKSARPKGSRPAETPPMQMLPKREADGRVLENSRYPLPRWHVEARRAALLRFKQAISRSAELANMSERQCLNRLYQEARSPIPARTIRRVGERLSAVGCLAWRSLNAQGTGTCFLLKDSYVLTSYHAVEMLAQGMEPGCWPTAIQDYAYVTFGFEEDGQGCPPLKLTGWLELYDQALDYAVLELATPAGVPGLLESSVTPAQAGNLYIVGHPDGEVKKVCPCSVMSGEQQGTGDSTQYLENLRSMIPGEAAECYLPDMVLVASHGFSRVRHPNATPFRADYHHGASGSAILDSEGCVVGLHCGGETHKRNKDPEKFYIEFGRSITLIIQNIVSKSDTVTTEKSKQIIAALQSSLK
ncbi:serine protease FAM111A-like [Hemitrygon akajei]|uniref:serine protease FAM111A-like n=1 Tax=Hemitrygon akajei TaxID=2704970 RepID=UPI003BF971B7